MILNHNSKCVALQLNLYLFITRWNFFILSPLKWNEIRKERHLSCYLKCIFNINVEVIYMRAHYQRKMTSVSKTEAVNRKKVCKKVASIYRWIHVILIKILSQISNIANTIERFMGCHKGNDLELLNETKRNETEW